MGVSYKKDGNRVDMGIKIGTVLSSEVWNIQVKSIKKGFWKDLAYIIHSGFISGYQNRYGDNLKPPTNVYHRMTA